MIIQKKPDYLLFASDAKSGELTSFPDVKRGWGVTIDQTASKPPMEWMNGAFNRIDANTLYMLQQGIPEWDAVVLYPVNAIIKYNGVLYISKISSNNVVPTSDPAKWTKLIQDASTSQAGIVKLSSSINSTSETEASTPAATKKAYDLAAGAVQKNGDTMTGDLTINKSIPRAILADKSGAGVVLVSNDVGFHVYDMKNTNNSAVTLNYASGAFNFKETPIIKDKPALKKGDAGVNAAAVNLSTNPTYMSSGFVKICATDLKITGMNNYEEICGFQSSSSGNTFAFQFFGVNTNGRPLRAFCRAVSGVSDASEIQEFITTANINNYSLPAGIPQPWPSTTLPTGWFKCNGATFDKNKYPRLAAAYPSGILPDLRGEFIRGWDDGKKVDDGRAILSNQGDAIRNITGALNNIVSSFSSNTSNDSALYFSNRRSPAYAGNSVGTHVDLNLDVSRTVPTANENRPRNVAFLYIVRAE
ncbi:phage tail protein [Orbaceae bacterium ESL0727]|nr:phage tail protein [Orbaceae bacterium ESL0727]